MAAKRNSKREHQAPKTPPTQDDSSEARLPEAKKWWAKSIWVVLLAAPVASLLSARGNPVSVELRAVRAQVDLGREKFELGRYGEAEAALGQVHSLALRLTTDADRVAAWPVLQAAAAHRAKAAARAAEFVPDPTDRSAALGRAEKLFANATRMDPKKALMVLPYVYEHARLLRRLRRVSEAVELFRRATEAAHAELKQLRAERKTAFSKEEEALQALHVLPWVHPEQMPCCGLIGRAARAEDAARAPRPWISDDPAAVSDLTVARALEEAAPEILRQVLSLAWGGSESPGEDAFVSLEGHGVERPDGVTGVTQGARAPWSELVLYDAVKGEWDQAACAMLPAACSALQGLPEIEAKFAPFEGTGEAFFFEGAEPPKPLCCRVELLRLGPQAHIVPHTAPTNERLKAHLGLSVPEGAALVVAGEAKPWRTGELLVFDDSFWHEAWNNHTTEGRLILSVDFWKYAAMRERR